MSMKHRKMIDCELAKAKTKHPKFCNSFAMIGYLHCKRMIDEYRRGCKEHGTAFHVIQEEVYEAVEAHYEGRLDDCLVELAQCGAVVLRMMEFVQAEIDAKKGGSK
jgi:hypothetical protein